MERSKGAVGVPEELAAALETDGEARAFREVRAGKALRMLQRKQKTLKT